MATELDVATAPAVTFTQEDLERIRQYEKIIKLSETITSGKHPRFKVPASLVSSNRATPDSSHPATTTNGVSAAKANALAHGANSHISHTSHASHTAKTATLPGLGLPAVGLSGFAAQRARIEAELQAQMKTAGKSQPESSDFLVDQVLQQARQLEKQFTPPPFAMSDLTAAGKQAPTDSGDDDTYYSSKFNTPEFGLAARIPAESDHGDVSMRDESSDYEPELDTVPSPKIQPPSQPQHPVQPVSLPQQDAAQLAEAFPNMTTEATQQILASLIALQAQNATQAVPIPPPSFQNNSQLPWQGSAAVSASVPPQVVRTHDLSPVAPQPEHISALAVGSRLPEGQRGTILGPATQASLHQGEVSQSSPDSSQQVGGRFSDRRKEKKKRAGGKRKADTAPSSPAIKSEPRSPSPIAAPLAPPPSKRQRHEQRAATGAAPRPGPAPARGTQYRRDEQYNPAAQRTHVESRPQYATTRVVRESRPPVVYERIEPGRYEHPQEVIVSHPPHRGYETYETYETYEQAPAIYAPQHAPPRPASTAYGQPLPRTTISAGYPAQAPRAIPSGRASVRPEAFERGHHGSPDMAPPVARVQRVSPAHTTGRILVDEYNREYYEPVRSAPGPGQGPEPRPANVIETVPYDPNVAYERPASRQLYATTAPRYARMGSQMPAVYGDEEVVYQRTSPSFAPPARRVVTQPEYVTREYVDYAPPPREYSRPVQYATGHPGEHSGAPLEDGPPPPPREYLVRAATARLPEAPRYEVPVPVQSRYVERVGSVRPVENGMGPGRMRGGLQYAPEGVYVEGHRGGEYGMRPAQGPGPMPGPGPASQALVPDNTLYYPDQPSLQMARPPSEYVYEDGTHEVYR